MTNKLLISLVILSITSVSLQEAIDKIDKTDDSESSPIEDAISAVLKEQNGQNIGSVVQNLLQEQGGKILGEALANFGKQNAGQLLQGLGSMLSNQDGKDKKGTDGENILETLGTLGSLMGSLQNSRDHKDNARSNEGSDNINILETIGSVVGNLQNNDGSDGGFNAENLIQGLGGLLNGGQNGQGLDVSMLGSLLDMFAQTQNNKNSQSDEPAQEKQVHSENLKTETNKKNKHKKSKKASEMKKSNEDSFDMVQLFSLAQSLFSQKTGKGAQEGFMQYVPMIMQTINAFTGSDAQQREKRHSDHSWKLPPFLEKIHVNFDHFMNSEMGKHVIDTIGAEKSFKVFKNEKGEFDNKKFSEMMENRSFRRHWLKVITQKLIDFLQYVTEPKVYRQYITSGQLFINSYLKTQGFPKSSFLDLKKPTESISSFINYVAKKYLDMKIQSREYVQPAIEYIKELLSLARKKGSTGEITELSEKLTDTINLDLIEPLARVNRAYRYAKAVPKCTRYVLCLVNEENQNEIESLPKLKQMLYQGSSLIAAWFLSNDSELPFWTLYSDITEANYCKKFYNSKCDGFHIEELKVTTEYVHSEL